MSKLLEEIKQDRLQARKSGNGFTANILTTLVGEASPSGNETTTDEQVQKVVTKFAKNTKEMLGYAKDSNKGDLEQELAIYESYLPKQMTEDELRDEIKLLLSGGCDNVGSIMKELNQNYKGQFDGKLASGLAKELT